MSQTNHHADRIRAGLEAKGLSVVATAARLGIAHQALSQVLTGNRPGRKHLARLAGMLDTTVDWLMSGNGEPPGWHTPNVRELARQAATLNQAQRDELLALLQPSPAVSGGDAPNLQRDLRELQGTSMACRNRVRAIEARLARIEQHLGIAAGMQSPEVHEPKGPS